MAVVVVDNPAVDSLVEDDSEKDKKDSEARRIAPVVVDNPAGESLEEVDSVGDNSVVDDSVVDNSVEDNSVGGSSAEDSPVECIAAGHGHAEGDMRVVELDAVVTQAVRTAAAVEGLEGRVE